jgi:hypothetical protein
MGSDEDLQERALREAKQRMAEFAVDHGPPPSNDVVLAAHQVVREQLVSLNGSFGFKIEACQDVRGGNAECIEISFADSSRPPVRIDLSFDGYGYSFTKRRDARIRQSGDPRFDVPVAFDPLTAKMRGKVREKRTDPYQEPPWRSAVAAIIDAACELLKPEST